MARWHTNRLNRAMDSIPGDKIGLLSMKTMGWSLDDYRRFAAGTPQAETVAKAAFGLQELYEGRIGVCRKHGVHPLSDDAQRMMNFSKDFNCLLPYDQLEIIKHAEMEEGLESYEGLRSSVEHNIALYDKEKSAILSDNNDRIFPNMDSLNDCFTTPSFFRADIDAVTALSKHAFDTLRDVYVGMQESQGASLAKLARICPKKGRELENARKKQSLLKGFTEAAGRNAAKSKKLI